jgi:hypothetical protein
MKKIPHSAKPLIHRDLKRKSEVFGFFEKFVEKGERRKE